MGASSATLAEACRVNRRSRSRLRSHEVKCRPTEPDVRSHAAHKAQDGLASAQLLARQLRRVHARLRASIPGGVATAAVPRHADLMEEVWPGLDLSHAAAVARHSATQAFTQGAWPEA
eukprot:1661107-Prymnesium_polylepis.3